MILATTDWHLDDNPDNEYRWEAIPRVVDLCRVHKVSHVIHLGDAVDRKDRFSGRFVNRLIAGFQEIAAVSPLDVLRGNHDTPLNGPAFFEFLNEMSGNISYVTDPKEIRGGIFLPFAADPAGEWSSIDFGKYEAAFMHQTVTGARGENGTELSGPTFPVFPKRLKIYSGDVHVPQRVGQVIYVGCPHPIKYGDTFPCRMLLLDEDTHDVVREIQIETVRKRVVEISSVEDLAGVVVARGDQVRVRVAVGADDVAGWGEIERRIAAWADLAGVSVTAVEAQVDAPRAAGTPDLDVDPRTILGDYAASEQVPAELLAMGLEILAEAVV